MRSGKKKRAIQNFSRSPSKKSQIITNTDDKSKKAKNVKTLQEVQQLPNYSPDTCTVFIGGVKDGVTDDTLRAHFRDYGDIENIDLKPKQFAFITFKTHKQAIEAVRNRTGSQIEGHTIRVGWAKHNAPHQGRVPGQEHNSGQGHHGHHQGSGPFF